MSIPAGDRLLGRGCSSPTLRRVQLCAIPRLAVLGLGKNLEFLANGHEVDLRAHFPLISIYCRLSSSMFSLMA